MILLLPRMCALWKIKLANHSDNVVATHSTQLPYTGLRTFDDVGVHRSVFETFRIEQFCSQYFYVMVRPSCTYLLNNEWTRFMLFAKENMDLLFKPNEKKFDLNNIFINALCSHTAQLWMNQLFLPFFLSDFITTYNHLRSLTTLQD